MTQTPGAGVGVTLEALSYRYPTGAATLQALSLSIAPGEFFTLLGPSGCGKTTTLRLVAGLLAPSSGRVLLGGRDMTGVPTHRRGLGVVFQNYALFLHMTVAANVAYGLKLRRLPRAAIAEAVAEALDAVGLSGLEDRMPRQLSGGQQQRVGLARAIAIKPKVMLLDEPLSNLDARLREEMCVEIVDIQRRLGMTVLYVTHDQAEALAMSDRIALMTKGGISEIGAPAQIYARPRTVQAASFLGDANLVPLTSDGVTCRFPGGQPASLAAAYPAGKLMVAIRPEAIHLSATRSSPATEPNCFPAIVTRQVYRGATTLLHLDAPGFSAPLLALALGPAPWQPGAPVDCCIAPADIQPLDDAP